MSMSNKTTLHIEATINATIQTIWEFWTDPSHITQWNQASSDWHCPKATNDLKPGGRFTSTMAAKDGSMSFEFGGIYDTITTHHLIEYTLDDGRQVKVVFSSQSDKVLIESDFEPEASNPHEMQQAGWQAILDSFKHYVEANG